MSAALFPLGQCVITPGAKAMLESIDVEPFTLLRRHQSGDWQEMDRHDQAANRAAIKE